MNSLGIPANVGQVWTKLDNLRQGAWYGTKTNMREVQQVLILLEEIKQWSTT